MNLFICFFFESIMNKVCVPFVIARDLCPYGKTVVTSILENMFELSNINISNDVISIVFQFVCFPGLCLYVLSQIDFKL